MVDSGWLMVDGGWWIPACRQAGMTDDACPQAGRDDVRR